MSSKRRDAAAISLADQASAAYTHAAATVRAVADQDTRIDLASVRWPFLDAMNVLIADAVRTGTVLGCPHVDPARPAVLHAFAHDPTHLRCLSCAERRERGLRIVGAPGCDRCGAAVRVFSGAASLGAVLLWFGLCESCRASQDDPQAGAA